MPDLQAACHTIKLRFRSLTSYQRA